MDRTIFFLLEVLGTIAFSSSGAMVGIKKQMDLLGVIVLGVTTAVGGGMLRDILIGVHPPALFTNPIYALLAFVTAVVLFLFVRIRNMNLEILESYGYERFMNLLDAIGLGAFTVVGIDTAIINGLEEYMFLTIFLGVITGVGGGLLRDIMAGITPVVLRKHVYACASIIGAFCYVLFLHISTEGIAVIISATIIVLIRLVASHYKWNLPRAF